MKLKNQHLVSGLIKSIIVGASLLLFSMNLLNQIVENKDLLTIRSLLATVPFLLIAVSGLWLTWRQLFSVICLVGGLMYTLDPQNGMDSSGAFFFMAAFHPHRKNYRIGISIYILTILCIATRATGIDITIPQIFNLWFVFTIKYFIYAVVFLMDLPQDRKIRMEKINKEDRSLLESLIFGMPLKIGRSKKQVSLLDIHTHLKVIQEKTNCENRDRLMFEVGCETALSDKSHDTKLKIIEAE